MTSDRHNHSDTKQANCQIKYRLVQMIVALARKLVIALWRFVTTGETLEGVVLRPAS